MPFIRIPMTSDAGLLADAALERLSSLWLDWEPNDGDLEVIQIETIAAMAQNAAEVAAIVPDAIFRGFGSNLIGLPYLPGTPAVGTATFTALDGAGYDAEGPIEFHLGGVAYLTDEDVAIVAPATSADFDFTALVVGDEGNDQSGVADAATALPWLDSIMVDDPTAGGTDPETDLEYQDRLADRLVLQSTTLVTGRDFELLALEDPRVGRALAIVGSARAVTVAVTDNEGLAFTGATRTAVVADLTELYEGYRQVNTTYTIIDATYTTITVTFTLVALPGYDPDELVSRAISTVEQWLHPFQWGQPQDQTWSTTVWLNETKVRYSELIRVLAILGTRYVKTATLNGGTTDITLSGTAPLTKTVAGGVTGTWAAS